MTAPARLLPRGIYTPLPTFFTPTEDLDLAAFAAHVAFTARAGTYPVTAGSAGEAPHLTPAERAGLIRTARRVLGGDDADVPVVAGVGAASTRETLALARDAAAAGADFVMVVAPGYYAGALKGPGGGEALRKYFVEVAEASPVPVVLYNFPAVAGGIDLDSELVVDVARRSGNVAGVKLT